MLLFYFNLLFLERSVILSCCLVYYLRHLFNKEPQHRFLFLMVSQKFIIYLYSIMMIHFHLYDQIHYHLIYDELIIQNFLLKVNRQMQGLVLQWVDVAINFHLYHDHQLIYPESFFSYILHVFPLFFHFIFSSQSHLASFKWLFHFHFDS